MAEVKYIQGMFVKRHPKAPEFVICNLSFKVEEFIKFLQDNQKDGYVNAQIKLSKKGSYYAQVDDYAGKGKTGSNSNENSEMTNVSSSEVNEPNKAESSDTGDTVSFPEDESIPF